MSSFKPSSSRKVFVMRGISGAGKTSYARSHFPSAAFFSADNFFETEKGYLFDASKLGDAHQACLHGFTEALRTTKQGLLVVDNTNCSVVEIAPYAALAQAYGWELEIVTIQCNPYVAAKRGMHGTALETVLAMHKRLVEADLPPWWPQSFVKPDEISAEDLGDGSPC